MPCQAMMANTFCCFLMSVLVSAVRKAEVDGDIKKTAVHADVGEAAEQGPIYNCDQHKLSYGAAAIGIGYCWSTCGIADHFRDCGQSRDDPNKFSVAVRLSETSTVGCSGAGILNVRVKCMVTDHKSEEESVHEKDTPKMNSTAMMGAIVDRMVHEIYKCDTHRMSLAGALTQTGYCWSTCGLTNQFRDCGEWKLKVKLDAFSEEGCSTDFPGGSYNSRVKCLVSDSNTGVDYQ